MTPNTWIFTHKRRKFSLTSPGVPDIEDIAYATAHINRFTGHVGVYSVAEHCVHVQRRVRDLGGTVDEQLAALLHDATEAYCGDASSPLKAAMRTTYDYVKVYCGAAWLSAPSDYDCVESRIWAAVAVAFDVPVELPLLVKQADHELVRIEAEHLWGDLPPDWGPLPAAPIANAERYAPLRWLGPLAAARYLSVFNDLVLAREGEEVLR